MAADQAGVAAVAGLGVDPVQPDHVRLIPRSSGVVQTDPQAILFDAGFTLTFHDGARLAGYAAKAGVTADAAALEQAERALREELRETKGS